MAYPLYTEAAYLGLLAYDKTETNLAEYNRIFDLMKHDIKKKWNLNEFRDAYELVEQYVTGFLEQEYSGK